MFIKHNTPRLCNLIYTYKMDYEIYYCNFNAFLRKCPKCSKEYDLKKIKERLLMHIDFYKTKESCYIDCFCSNCGTWYKEFIDLTFYKSICFIS